MDERPAPVTSGWAIASLVTSILCLGPVALILGIVGLVSIGRSDGQKTGRGFAWAGIIISVITMLIGAAIFVLAMMGVMAISGLVEEQRPILLMEDLARAQENFRAQDSDGNGRNDYWTSDAARLAPSSGVDSNYRIVAMTMDQDGKPYALDPDGDGKATTNPDRFGICLHAADPARKAVKTYIVNEQGVVYVKDTGGKPQLSWPKDPEAEGWARATLPSSSSSDDFDFD